MSKDSTIINEGLIESQPIPIDIEGTKKILYQMENCICKIYEDNGKKGTGFFCKIPFPDKNNLLPFLITNNHILNENDIENNKIINLTIYNKDKNENIEKKIKIDDSRKTFSLLNKDEGIDITFIEIKPRKDNIDKFLEFDEKILEVECKRKSIYTLHNPKDKVLVSYGLINKIKKDKQIVHHCNTEEGSSGSPILSLDKFKVIGVHYGTNSKFKLNYGTFIKNILNEFYNKYKTNRYNINNNNKIFNNNMNSINNNFSNMNINNINSNFNNNFNFNNNNINYNQNDNLENIHLNFIFKEYKKKIYLDINENELFSNTINQLEDKYQWLRRINGKQYFFHKNQIAQNKTIKEIGLVNNSNISIKVKKIT